MSLKKAFVCGATGTQGGNVATHLLSQSVAVHFLTRDPSSPKARELISLGATLFPGTYDDPSAIAAAVAGCDGLFLNCMPSFTDPNEEVRHAQAIIAAAKEAGITSAVYSSILGIDEIPKLPLWDPNGPASTFFSTKVQITQLTRDNFENWTIILPGKFMGDFLKPRVTRLFPGLVETGVFTTGLRKHDRIPLVDPNTIGAFGAAALMNPEKFGGKYVDVFDQLATAEELVSMIGKATGREMSVKFLSDEELAEHVRNGNIFVLAQTLMRDADAYADPEKVEKWGVPLTQFDKFLQREKEHVIESYGQVA